MLDKRPCNVKTASELDEEIRDILHLDATQRAPEKVKMRASAN